MPWKRGGDPRYRRTTRQITSCRCLASSLLHLWPPPENNSSSNATTMRRTRNPMSDFIETSGALAFLRKATLIQTASTIFAPLPSTCPAHARLAEAWLLGTNDRQTQTGPSEHPTNTRTSLYRTSDTRTSPLLGKAATSPRILTSRQRRDMTYNMTGC